MNRQELIDRVAEKAGTTKAAAGRMMEALFDSAGGAISEAVKAGRQVRIPGFGKFSPKVRKARKGRNPQTGAAIDIPESKVVGFTPGKGLRDSVAGKGGTAKKASAGAKKAASGAKKTVSGAKETGSGAKRTAAAAAKKTTAAAKKPAGVAKKPATAAKKAAAGAGKGSGGAKKTTTAGRKSATAAKKPAAGGSSKPAGSRKG
jgi:DNA-binding protein HU-beta